MVETDSQIQRTNRGYHQGEKRKEGQDRDKGLEVQATMYKINKLYGYIGQHREYNQYFITLN